MTLATGTQLGPYKIVAPLGKGGMGEVYRAKDTRLGREVAIKVLPDHLAQDADALKRFEREAKAVAALSHPNILTIHDVGSEQGVSFAVMELLEGETLRSTLAGGGFSWRKSVEIGTAVAEGLAAAHSKGIIHRDLKPENIFITWDGRIKILDFGLARYKPHVLQQELTEAPTESKLTESGIVMGTVPYMSPEQVRGEPVDACTDIFSFGCVLSEMITGKRAFHRDTSAETISAILRDEPPELPENIPAELAHIIAHCLEKNSAKRFQTASDLVFDLKRINSHSVGRASVPAGQIAGKDARATNVKRAATIGAAVISLAAMFALIFGLRKQPSEETTAPKIQSLAVLPLKNLSDDPEQQYFADGMTEALITDLTKISALKVISRTSAMQYKETDKPVPQIARELNVDAVIEGSVLRSGERVRITANLIEGDTDKQLWAESYERDLRDVLSLQSEVARAIADQIKIKLTAQEQARFADSRTVNSEAHELYLKGRYFWNKRTEEGFRKAIEYFNQAIEKDPTYALPYAGLASCYVLMGHELYGILHPKEAYPKAKAAAMKALELDETLGEAHAVLAYSKHRYDWDWSGSEKEHKRSIELNPGYATAHQWYSHFLLPAGRAQESLVESKKALELDPLSLIINLHLGWHYLYVRQHDKAIEQLQKTLELDPNFILAHLFLGQAYEEKARYPEAITEFQKGVDLSNDGPVHLGALGHAYAVSGNNSEAQKVLDHLKELSKHRYVPSYEIAVVYAGLREKDAAFDWLQKAVEERDSSWLVDLKVDPRFDHLHSEPRFQDLLRRIGLQP